MRKLALSLTMALALGALAVPTVASAAKNQGNHGMVVQNFSGNRSVNATRSYKSNFSTTRNVANVRTQNLAVNNGQRWAWSGRHHRHHRGWWYPAAAIGAYGLYSAYDNCWDTVWTPSGYQRVYVCGPDDYGYY